MSYLVLTKGIALHSIDSAYCSMLSRVYIWFIILVMGGFCSFAQESETPGVAMYLELAGKGFISGNVDFPLGANNRLTVGATMLDHEFAKEAYEDEYPTQTLPTPSLMYFHLFGNERHYFEAGLGVSVSPVPWKEYSKNDSPLSLHGCLGYRFQAPDQFFFRAGFTPFYRVNWMVLPLVGVSLGYSW